MPRCARSCRAARARPARWMVIAALALGLAACSVGPFAAPHPAPAARSTPTLVEAQAIVANAAAASELRWNESAGNQARSWYVGGELVLDSSGFNGLLKGSGLRGVTLTQALQAPDGAVERFLSALAATPVQEGRNALYSSSLLEYSAGAEVEFVTAAGTAYFSCIERLEDCTTWGVEVIPGRRKDSRFPNGMGSSERNKAVFITTDPRLRDALNQLLRELGIDGAHDMMMGRSR